MRIERFFTILIFLAFGLSADALLAQDLHPSRRASPLGMARGFSGDTYVKVTYGRPYKRGRDNIIGASGAMHAYGEVWRFGANEPTEVTFSGPVMFGGQRVEAGTYSIFATPGERSWTLYVNTLNGGGANQYDAEKNVAEAAVEVMAMEEEVEQFTIELEDAGDALHMVTSWLNWKLAVPITEAK